MKPPNPDSAENLTQVLELWQRVGRGEVTTAHLKWFNGLDKKARDACVAGKPTPLQFTETAPNPKFKLIADLGVITVPKNYRHPIRLDTFMTKHRSKFSYVDECMDGAGIADENFSQVSTKLSPGQKLVVKIFISVDKYISHKECMEFLNNQNCVFVGAQGATLVFEQKRSLLKGLAKQLAVADESGNDYHVFLSLDNSKNLFRENGKRYVVGLSYGEEGGWNLYLYKAWCKYGNDTSFLCFNWVTDETAPANDNVKTDSPDEKEKPKKDWEL